MSGTLDRTDGPVATGAYRRIEQMLADDVCVLLDGAMGTELDAILPMQGRHDEERIWGTRALYDAPHAVMDVHRRYLRAGCDVITTNTWGLFGDLGLESRELVGAARPLHWMDVARRGIQLAREAIRETGRGDDVALAFSLGADAFDPDSQETLALLARAFEQDRPDLILVETLSLIRDDVTFDDVATLLATGIPLWLSFRRCRLGVCGIYGQHWGGPEGDIFGRAAHRFEQLGVGALLINCLPPDHVPGMISWLRDFTDLPLGVYPNLGYYTEAGWNVDETVDPTQYATIALGWRDEGAAIVGGCCGVRPEHIEAAGEALADTKPGPRRPPAGLPATPTGPLALGASVARTSWVDSGGRVLYPLELPEIVCEPGVFLPTQGSFLVWKHLFREGVGEGKRCLDIGCGAGILTVQLALNGATNVHAIDLDRAAVANTLSNAFRNDVSDRVSGTAADLLSWVPEESYDVIVASLYQMPVDPYEQLVSHRPLDYWGRNLVDHVINLLPTALADDGVAYVMQLSILSQQWTDQLLRERGLRARVVDFAFFAFSDVFRAAKPQIERVERQSDAYHLTFSDEDVLVAYLLEITTNPEEPTA
jgi:homocysteine S-methyltransferase